MARIIAIANQKGGVGKTTTAINLSACLAVAEKRTLLIDIDPQANTTSGLGIDHSGDSKSIYEVIIEEEDISKVVLSTDISSSKSIIGLPECQRSFSPKLIITLYYIIL